MALRPTPSALCSTTSDSKTSDFAMLKNYFKIAFRNLLYQKAYSFINIFGLSVGLAACLLIALYVRLELSFDRFHAKAGRIVRVTQHLENSREGEWRWAYAPDPLAAELKANFPEVEETASVNVYSNKLVQCGDRRFYEDQFAFVNPEVFKLFDFSVRRGDPATGLAPPFKVFLSQSAARKYFGEENPLGKTLTLGNQHVFEITGIFADLPPNSHLQFRFAASRESQYFMGWKRDDWFSNALTYVLLRQPRDATSLETKLPALAIKHFGEPAKKRFSLIPLMDIHLYASDLKDPAPQSDIRYVYLFSSIALLILFIACINYVNLATARAAKRAREVGVRKVVGAGRIQLVRQFLGESVMLSIMALGLSLALVEVLLPFFNRLMNRSLQVNVLEISWLLPVLAGTIVVVGLLAGSYPAWFLSAFRPAIVLKGEVCSPAFRALRQGLVVFQFGVSVALIIGTLIIQQQLHFLQQQRPGFDKAQIVTIPTRGELKNDYAAFKSELLQHPSIERVTTASSLLGSYWIHSIPLKKIEEAPGDGYFFVDGFQVDYDFFATLGLEIIRGRAFSPDFPSDVTNAVIINETAVRKLGWEEPLGKHIELSGQRVVVGVVKDFHYKTHRAPIEPIVITLTDSVSTLIAAKISPGDLPGTLASMKKTWETMVPSLPFQYAFLDEEFDALYRTERRLGQLFGAFASLAVLIACLGLFGLAAYLAQLRTKEVGIRKVLGATVTNIIVLLSKEFVKLVLIANLIAWPVAYFAMNKWLQDFAYRIGINWWIFALAGGLALLIALLTISMQAVKAALANPVEALRYE